MTSKGPSVRIHWMVWVLLSGASGWATGAPAPRCPPKTYLPGYLPSLPQTGDREQAPVDVLAQSVTIIEQNQYRLSGQVDIRRADQRLAADRMDYDAQSQKAQASGQVIYQDRLLLVQADQAHSDLAQDATSLSQVRYQLLGGVPGKALDAGQGTAKEVHVSRAGDRQTTRLSTVTFSTCPLGSNDWALEAESIELDHAAHQGRARDVRLRFKDWTLLALPYASFPIDDQRKSGFLMPGFGGSNNGGVDVSLPYYWNLAPNYDATLTPRLITRRGTMLGTELRYLAETHQGVFRGEWMPHDRLADRSRHSWSLQQQGVLSPHFYWVADLSRVSDDRYFEDFGDSLVGASVAWLPSNVYLYGQGEGWHLEVGGDDTQIANPRVTDAVQPYRRLPRLAADWERDFGDHLRLGAYTEAVSFHKDLAISGQRYDMRPYVEALWERAGWYVNPGLAYRHTFYRLDGGAERSRGTPIFDFDAGLFLERPWTWWGQSMTQTLEPRLYYLRVPYRDQSDLPIFDTQELPFSFAQLFRWNRFTGADRQTDANQLTLALTTRWLEDSVGRERMRASIGQVRYFEPRRVQLPDAGAGWANDRSELAAEWEWTLNDRWRLMFSHLYDPDAQDTGLSAVRIQHRFGELGVANLDYRYRRGEIEQVDGSAVFPLTPRWRAIARWNYSWHENRTLEALAGLEYQSCCHAIRVLGRHYVRNIEGDTANGLFLELELRGLGSLGRKSEDFLQQAIAGYRRP